MKPTRLELAKQLSLEAGKFAFSQFNEVHHVQYKDTLFNDPVTDVDRACEKIIVEGIQKYFPEDGIIGEEGGPYLPGACCGVMVCGIGSVACGTGIAACVSPSFFKFAACTSNAETRNFPVLFIYVTSFQAIHTLTRGTAQNPIREPAFPTARE